MKRRVIAILCSLLILCLAACAGSEMGSTLNEQTNGFDVTAKNADGSAVNGHITLKKGECLLVNPLLDKGEFQITVYPEGQKDKVLLDETISGRVFSTYDLEPGEYEIVVTAGKKATGSLSILPGNTEELNAQDEALSELIGELENLPGMGGSLPAIGEGDDIPLPEGFGDGIPDFGMAISGLIDQAIPLMGVYTGGDFTVIAQLDGDNKATFLVETATDSEMTIWSMSGEYEPTTGIVEYSDGSKELVTTSEKEAEAVRTTVYENGKGRFIIDKEAGILTWEDDQEHAADGVEFSH